MLLPLLLASALAAPLQAETSFPEMRTDPRFELLAMIQLLAGADKRYAGFQRHDIPYQREALAHFSRFEKHPAVKRYVQLADSGLDYLLAYQFVFALSDPPELALREQLPAPLVERMGGAQRVEEFRRLLADFSKDSGFPSFYKRMEPELGGMLAEVRGQALKVDIRKKLEDYIGAPIGVRYDFIISPFAQPVLVATYNRSDADGTRRVTSLYGPEEFEGKLAFRFDLRVGGIWCELMMERLLAEGEPFRASLAGSGALYEPLGAACASSWYDCAQRHIAFAVGARLLELNGGAVAAHEWPIKYARVGLPYLAPLIEKLAEYEADRARYPTLSSFYPRLVETFDSLVARERKKLVYSGDIKGILAASGPVVIIAPAPAKSPAGLPARVDEFKKKRWPTAEVLTGEQAVATDLSGKSLIVIGTLANNAWLARHYDDLELPIRVESDKISFNKLVGEQGLYTYGGGVGLITAALNPFDGTRPALVYTALRPEVLPGLLDAYQGPADYVLLEDGALLRVGLYEKSRVPWRVK